MFGTLSDPCKMFVIFQVGCCRNLQLLYFADQFWVYVKYMVYRIVSFDILELSKTVPNHDTAELFLG